MATRKNDPAKKARKTIAPKKGVKKAKAKKQVPARAKVSKPNTKALQARARTSSELAAAALAGINFSQTIGRQVREGVDSAEARAVAALASPPKPRRWARFRSAITGLFVSLGFAKKHPDTTVRERVDYDGLV